MGVPDIVKLLTESGTTVVVLAIGLWVFFNRAKRDEAERRDLFRHVLHGDGNGQSGLTEIGETVKKINDTVTINSGRISRLETAVTDFGTGIAALSDQATRFTTFMEGCPRMAGGECLSAGEAS